MRSAVNLIASAMRPMCPAPGSAAVATGSKTLLAELDLSGSVTAAEAEFEVGNYDAFYVHIQGFAATSAQGSIDFSFDNKSSWSGGSQIRLTDLTEALTTNASPKSIIFAAAASPSGIYGDYMIYGAGAAGIRTCYNGWSNGNAYGQSGWVGALAAATHIRIADVTAATAGIVQVWGIEFASTATGSVDFSSANSPWAVGVSAYDIAVFNAATAIKNSTTPNRVTFRNKLTGQGSFEATGYADAYVDASTDGWTTVDTAVNFSLDTTSHQGVCEIIGLQSAARPVVFGQVAASTTVAQNRAAGLVAGGTDEIEVHSHFDDTAHDTGSMEVFLASLSSVSVETLAFSADASKDVTVTGFDGCLIVATALTLSASAGVALLLSTDGGSTFTNTNGWARAGFAATFAVNSATESEAIIGGSNGTTQRILANMFGLWDGAYPGIRLQAEGNSITRFTGLNYRGSSSEVTTLRIYPTSGTATGNVVVVKYKL